VISSFVPWLIEFYSLPFLTSRHESISGGSVQYLAGFGDSLRGRMLRDVKALKG
jgi:hypothetical protein